MSLSQQVLKEAGQLNLLNMSGSPLEITNLTAAKTLLASDTGRIFTLDLAGGFTVTLPAVATAGAGWNAIFIVKTAPTTHYNITSPAADMHSVLVSSTGGDVSGECTAGTASATIRFAANVATATDRIDIIGNGVSYYALARFDADAAVTTP